MYNFVHFYFLFFVHFNFIIYTVEQVLDSEESLEVSGIVIKAVQMLSTNDKPKRKEKSKPNKMDENDIRFIVEEGRRNKKSAYESLKEKGLIKQVEKDFFKAV